MTKIIEEAYDLIKKNIATLLCDKPDDAILRCLNGWMLLNDIHIILQRLYEAGQEPKNE